MKRPMEQYLPDGCVTVRQTVGTVSLLALVLLHTKVDAQEASEPSVAGRVVIENLSWEQEEVLQYCADEAHAALMKDDPYPSAKKCGTCHPQHYREWSVSPHAYAQLSPIFNCMQNAVKILTNGTNGDFCIRPR